MIEEMAAQHENTTSELVEFPKGKKLLAVHS